MPINGLIKLRTALVNFDLEQEQFEILRDNREALADLQAQVLAEGKNKEGRVRDDEYAPFTVRYKKEFGKGLGGITDRVTFYMTGKTYANLRAYLTKYTYIVKAPLETWDKLYERIGENNYGIDRERQLEYFENVNVPGVRKILFTKTGLTF